MLISGRMLNVTTPSLNRQLHDALAAAIAAAYPDHQDADPLIRPSDHADAQANAALALAKKVGSAPREVAQKLVAGLDQHLLTDVQISGPGFVNLTLADSALWNQVVARSSDERLGIETTQAGVRTVIDYSSPNIAKEMHVGHLRSSVIGDALARIMEFLGATVLRQNHLGDWGTQFGMLIQFMAEHPDEPWRAKDVVGTEHESAVSALNALYQKARGVFDSDPGFADRARARVVALQAGDAETLAVWEEIRDESQGAFAAVYERLGLSLTLEHTAGESFYNDRLADVTAALVELGVVVESDGALVFFSDEVKGQDGNPAALIVRKSDGGYGYGTTDLATIYYRINDLAADRILYVVGSPQALHFQLLFEAAKRAGWLTDSVQAEHVPFGQVLGTDGKAFKTREGKAARLMDLLDDAVAAARKVVVEGAEAKGQAFSDADLTAISEAAGIGAVKYADLSTNRIKDYTFDTDRMVAFNGNTGVYLQYAHTRMGSILRRAADTDFVADEAVASPPAAVASPPAADALVAPLEPAERELILTIDQLGDVLESVATELTPHLLCTYAYNVARAFTEFYEACPVLNSEPAIRARRLALVNLTKSTLAQSLELLGIVPLERM